MWVACIALTSVGDVVVGSVDHSLTMEEVVGCWSESKSHFLCPQLPVR